MSGIPQSTARRVTARCVKVTGTAGQEVSRLRFAKLARRNESKPLGGRLEVSRMEVRDLATKVIKRQPDGQRGPCVARIWHWRAKKYLYASDYGLKGFPIGR